MSYYFLELYSKLVYFKKLDQDFNELYSIEKKLDFFTFDDISINYPEDFKPDVILVFHPEYHYVPIGIEKVNAFIVACVGDWNVNFINLLDDLKKFDLIITDLHGVDKFKLNGFNNVEFFPLFSLQTPDFFDVQNVLKDYDICFVGNLNSEIQIDRNSYLYRIGKMSNKYKVLIETALFNYDYRYALARSKIIFNRSIRYELNMRLFEGFHAKSLVFIEDSNKEVPLYLKDRENLVLYNDKNLEELLDFYINNDLEREKIITNATNFIEKNTTTSFKKSLYKKAVDSKKETLTKNRLFGIFDKNKKVNLLFRDVFFDTDDLKLFKLCSIEEFKNLELELTINNKFIYNYLYFNTFNNQENLEKAYFIYEQSEKENSNYMPIKANFLLFLLKNNQKEKALELLKKYCEIIENNKFNLDDFSGLLIESRYDITRFATEIEAIFANNIEEKVLIEKLKNIYYWKFSYLSAILSFEFELYEDFIKYANVANSIISRYDIDNLLGNFYKLQGDLKKTYHYFYKSFKENPFYFKNTYDLVHLELYTNYSLSNIYEKDWIAFLDSCPKINKLIKEEINYDEINIKQKLENYEKEHDNIEISEYILEKVLELDKFNVIANFGLAKILVDKKDFKKALEHLKNIITKKSDKETLDLVKLCLGALKDTNTLNSLS